MKIFLKFMICFLLLFSIGHKAYPQEEKVQALYLYNFIKYMEWAGQKQITIGVLGNTPALLELTKMAERNPEKVKIIKLAGDNLIKTCNIIFIPSPQSRNFQTVQKNVQGLSIIVVTEDKNLINQGAEIAFFTEANKLKFIMNRKAIEETKVKVSSSLYALSKMVNN